MENKKDSNVSELQIKFTVWMRTVLQNAKSNYIRDNTSKLKTISLTDILEDQLSYKDTYKEDGLDLEQGLFDFQDKLIERAFLRLSIKQRKILLLSIVEGYKPCEIAKLLDCSPQIIYNEKMLALKYLRKTLNLGGNSND